MFRKKLIIMLSLAAIATASSGCGKTVQPMSESLSDNSDLSAVGTDNSPTTENALTEISTEPATQPATEPLEMPDSYKTSGACLLEVETVMQKPELPTGCEVTALTAALNYCGFDIDKLELCDNFLPISSDADLTFHEAYIGDPRADNGFGCYAPVIAVTAENYFDSIDADWAALDLTGTDFHELFYQLEKGRPVVIWASMGLKDVNLTLRWTTDDGDEAWFSALEHCMVLKGYDEENDIVYVCDPLKGDMEYSLSRFENVYEQMGKQAVIIYEMEN